MFLSFSKRDSESGLCFCAVNEILMAVAIYIPYQREVKAENMAGNFVI
jgi:hypothetical protein